MDWELYDRQRATVVFLSVILLSFLLLIFRHSSIVVRFRGFLVVCTLPSQRAVSWLGLPSSARHAEDALAVAPAVASDAVPVLPIEQAEQSRRLLSLQQENIRLNRLLNLKEKRWPRAIAARVIGREPQRWFQELILNKGKKDGLLLDQPVIALSGSREALIGRMVDVGPEIGKVMLVHDSLSAVAAAVEGQSQVDGVVEGTNSHDLIFKYIGRDAPIKIGDLVVTSGLGEKFPEGIMLGWVEEIGLDPRQLFLQARLRPAVEARQLGTVFVLATESDE